MGSHSMEVLPEARVERLWRPPAYAALSIGIVLPAFHAKEHISKVGHSFWAAFLGTNGARRRLDCSWGASSQRAAQCLRPSERSHVVRGDRYGHFGRRMSAQNGSDVRCRRAD